MNCKIGEHMLYLEGLYQVIHILLLCLLLLSWIAVIDQAWGEMSDRSGISCGGNELLN